MATPPCCCLWGAQVYWHLHHWPLLRHRGPGEAITKGIVRITVAPSRAHLDKVT